jgi:hypothetical protein
MKKLIMAAIVAIAIASSVSAQSKSTNTTPANNKNSRGYVDNNKNGVCDNYENNTCQYAGKGPAQCRKGEYGMRNGQGCGNRPCRQNGKGRGRS